MQDMVLVKVEDLKPGVMGIYKITFPNNKIYIGMSKDIRRRFWEHNNKNNSETPCDKAINKYGKIETVEILEFVEDKELLSEREIYWINKFSSNQREIGYNLTPGGDGSSTRQTFPREDIISIRKRKYLGERKKDVYKDYTSYSFATFEKVWLYITHREIGSEFYIDAGARSEISSFVNKGEKNGRAKLTNDEVLFMRKLYDEGEKVSYIRKEHFPEHSYNAISYACKRKTFKNI